MNLVVVFQVEERQALEHPGHLGVPHDLLVVLRLLVDGVPDPLFTLFDGNLVQLLQREAHHRGLPQHVAEKVFPSFARRLGERVDHVTELLLKVFVDLVVGAGFTHHNRIFWKSGRTLRLRLVQYSRVGVKDGQFDFLG